MVPKYEVLASNLVYYGAAQHTDHTLTIARQRLLSVLFGQYCIPLSEYTSLSTGLKTKPLWSLETGRQLWPGS